MTPTPNEHTLPSSNPANMRNIYINACFIKQKLYIYIHDIHITTSTSVPNLYLCSQPLPVFPTSTSVPNHYQCSQPLPVFPTSTSVPNLYLCSQPLYVFPTSICVPNLYMCSQPLPVFPTSTVYNIHVFVNHYHKYQIPITTGRGIAQNM